jgi:hypothetical protein
VKSFFIFILIGSIGTEAFAKVTASSLYRMYDDGDTKVNSPHLDVSATMFGDRVTLAAGFAQDIITSASSDVRSYSSKASISDTRTEGSATLSLQLDDGNVGWSFIRSQETDYKSNIFAFAGTREFFEKNTTLFTSFAYGEDRISTSKDPELNRPMTHSSYSLALSQLLGRASLIQFLVDARVESGYLASPYRQARKYNADGTGTVVGLPENHPLTRNRLSMALKYNLFLDFIKTSTATSLRAYADSWGVQSATLEERFSRELGSKIELAFNLRYYKQRQASFYKDIYTDLGPYFTGNKTLSNFDSYLVGLRPTYKFTEKLGLYFKYEYYKIKYENHTDLGRLNDRTDDKEATTTANIVGIGLEGEF